MSLSDVTSAGKVGCTTAASFNASTSTATQLVILPLTGPVLMLLIPTANCYIRQGDASVSASAVDTYLAANAPYPLVIENADESYLAVLGVTTSGTLRATVTSNTQSICPAAVNSPYAVFAGGLTAAATPTAVSTEYVFATDVMTVGTSLTTSCWWSGTAGSTSFGIIFGGQLPASVETNVTQKYTYATHIVAGGTNLAATWASNMAIGNTTRGVTGCATRNSAASLTTEKYTYATDTVGSGGSLPSSSTGSTVPRQSLSIAAKGYICGGSSVTIRQRVEQYVFSSDVATSLGNVLSAIIDRASAFGNTTFGILAGGSTGGNASTTEKFTYSSETGAGSTALTAGRSNSSMGTGNDLVGIMYSGKIGVPFASATTEIYTFSGDTTAAGGAALTSVENAYAMSPSYGGLQ